MILRRHGEDSGLLNARYEDDTYATDASPVEPDTTASRNRIIIGVVVGGVAAIAITAGILFVLIKKRKWDRIKRHEEQLLVMHASAPYNKSTAFASEDYAMASQRPSSSFMSYNQQTRASVESPPPSYQPYPAYDPLSYHRVSHLPSNVKPARGSTGGTAHGHISHGPSGSLAGLGLGSDRSGIPLAAMGTQPTQSQPFSQQNSRGPSPEGSMSIHSDEISAAPASDTRTPRRPKPVLTKLVTSFG